MIKLNEKFIEEINFPDGQVHYKINPLGLVRYTDNTDVEYTISIKTPKGLYKLQVINALLKQSGYKLKHLTIPYLMGGRYDRAMSDFDINPLKIIIDTINSLNIEKITLFEPHSDVSIALFNARVNVEYFNFQKIIDDYINKEKNIDYSNVVVVFPDNGALKRYSKQINENILFMTANKVRNLETGDLNLKINYNNTLLLNKKKFFIVDDLCDGGATFIALAKELNIDRDYLTLIVPHGIFSKGVDELFRYYSEIHTTDSYYNRDLDVEIIDSNFVIHSTFYGLDF